MTVRRPSPRLSGPRLPAQEEYLVSPSGMIHRSTGQRRDTSTGLILERTPCGRWVGSKALVLGPLPQRCPKCFKSQD